MIFNLMMDGSKYPVEKIKGLAIQSLKRDDRVVLSYPEELWVKHNEMNICVNGPIYAVTFTPNNLGVIVAHAYEPFISYFTREDLDQPWVEQNSLANLDHACTGIAMTPDGLDMAIACENTPGLLYYTRFEMDTASWQLQPDPVGKATLVTDVAFTPDGRGMAVILQNAPYLSFYTRDKAGSLHWQKQPDPEHLPQRSINGIAFTPDGLCMLVAHMGSPSLSCYTRTTELSPIWTKQDFIAELPEENAYNVAVHPDGSCIIVMHKGAPYRTLYVKTVHGTWAQFQYPWAPSSEEGYAAAFSPDGKIMAIAEMGRLLCYMRETLPRISMYQGLHSLPEDAQSLGITETAMDKHGVGIVKKLI